MVPILMYHNVARPPEGMRRSELFVPPGTFARQMKLLRLLRYRGVSMSEAMPYLRGEQRGRVVALTFDDGYADTVEHALPVLQAAGFTATCYVVSGAIGGPNAWAAETLGVSRPLADEAQLRTWATAGMEVGAHTRTHPRLTECDEAALQEEVADCRAELKGLTGADVTQFCYPFGECDDRVAAAVRAAGYVAAVTTQRGRAEAGADLFRLPRVLMRGDDREGRLLLKLLTGYEEHRGRARRPVHSA
jgi:peptidoglycan/xylan/chitin deacetylase (PgdA/CDA1 family)